MPTDAERRQLVVQCLALKQALLARYWIVSVEDLAKTRATCKAWKTAINSFGDQLLRDLVSLEVPEALVIQENLAFQRSRGGSSGSTSGTSGRRR